LLLQPFQLLLLQQHCLCQGVHHWQQALLLQRLLLQQWLQDLLLYLLQGVLLLCQELCGQGTEVNARCRCHL
jgi:hypothetical protein